ncbi:protein DENND6B-like [Pollicipes pollicipes]|uniref:protein DENND6B-like n=1 Tax=Pollicipes pollicipes TaxID=41117 RepID=UPI0018856671|nr:protein DENND6B-like [Pollicipes pollicipes]
MSILGGAGDARPFNPDDFCQRLGDSGPQLTTGIKGDWVGLYRRFFRSTNFSHWFNERHDDISRKLQALHLEALSDADVLTWVKDKQEVEVVDLVLRLRRKLADADTDRLPVHASTLAKLRLQLRDVTRSLPEDVRAVLKHRFCQPDVPSWCSAARRLGPVEAGVRR